MELPTESINAEAVWAVIDDRRQASCKPIRPGRHRLNIPYGMVWNMTAVMVIGGGLGGLAAAITAAEAGASVTLHEAHRTLGGRWRSTPVRKKARANPAGNSGASPGANPSPDAPVYRAHEGPHVIYRDGPIWAWLKERDLLGVTCGVPLGATVRFRFWHQGRLRAVPPLGFLRAVRVSSRKDVPVDQSFRDWASRLVGEDGGLRIRSWALPP